MKHEPAVFTTRIHWKLLKGGERESDRETQREAERERDRRKRDH